MPHQSDRRGAAGPWASLLLALCAVLLYLTPDLTAWATYDRTALANGQLWRLVTGHWTHWSAEHLGWDLLVFAVVGRALELRGRRRAFLTCTVLSALLISGGVFVLRPGMDEYRGLSGIDCALVTLIAVDLLRQSLRERQRGLSLALAALLAAYLGKVAFELATGQTLFVDSGPGLFVPVPLAHVLGGAVGIALGLVTSASIVRCVGRADQGTAKPAGDRVRARGPQMPTDKCVAIGRVLSATVALLCAGSAVVASSPAEGAPPSTQETPTEAALALLFAPDMKTALEHLPQGFRNEFSVLPEAYRKMIVGSLLFARSLEATGARVERRERQGKPEVFFELPRGRETGSVSLEREEVDGAKATLHCQLSSGGQDGALVVRMIREEGSWRVAGLQGPSEPEPDSLQALWGNLENPRIAERIEASQRRVNESRVIGDIRMTISAEATFAAFSGGSYGSPECLASPASCLPEYTGPPMVGSIAPWASPRGGYVRTFHPGPPGRGPGVENTQASERLFSSYAFVAVPLVPGTTGTRSFCGDSTGRICVTDDGSVPAVHEGLCASPCTELR